MLAVLTLCGAILIGISLGMMGAGGSILMTPLLVLILHRPEKLAIAESLAIVAGMAAFGTWTYMQTSEIDWRSVFIFGIPGIVGAYSGSYFSFYISAWWQMILLACMSVLIAVLMLFSPNQMPWRFSNKWLSPFGFGTGVITGIIGIGGGFVIVPALIALRGISMQAAVGASLVIIFLNAITSCIMHLMQLHVLQVQVSWSTILFISIAGICGVVIGKKIAKYFSEKYLKRLFGSVILMVGFTLLIHLIA